MARLFDKIAKEGFISGKERMGWFPGLLPEIFTINNVAEYFYSQCPEETNKAGQRIINVFKGWAIDDFPNLAPPFQHYWMEFNYSTGWPVSDIVGRVGVVARAFDIEPDKTAFIQGREQRIIEINDHEFPARTDTKWVVVYNLFLEMRGHSKILEVIRMYLPLNSEGAVSSARGATALMEYPSDSIEELGDKKLNDIIVMFVYPALLATTFLHCKNVVMSENKPEPRVAKKYMEKAGRELVTFKTLEILPLTRVLRHAGSHHADTGLKKALHICRGHFAEFGPKYKHEDGSPKGKLFGKIEGRFFMGQSIKGRSSAGVVVKDYEVKK